MPVVCRLSSFDLLASHNLVGILENDVVLPVVVIDALALGDLCSAVYHTTVCSVVSVNAAFRFIL
jgi:hypothetical protein